MSKTAIISIFVVLLLAGRSAVFAGSVPAGTAINVKTLDAIGSHEKSGRTFRAQLAQNTAGLKAGTQFKGHVVASRGNYAGAHSAMPLTLDLTSATVDGRSVKVKTTGPVQPEPPSKTARQVRAGVTVGESTFVPGTALQFTLAKAMTW